MSFASWAAGRQRSVPDGASEQEKTWLRMLARVLGEVYDFGASRGPWPLRPYLFLGDAEQAKDRDRLRHLGINHVLNCAEDDIRTGHQFYGDGFVYSGFSAQDKADYPLLQNHYHMAAAFIEKARQTNGKVLIHCVAGINRSGSLGVAYLLDVEKPRDFLELVRDAKDRRGALMTNTGFRYQIVQFAMERNLTLELPSCM